MNSKIIKIKPGDLSGMKFKEVKALLKKDLALLAEQPEGTPFFVATDFKFSDFDDQPILVVGTPKGSWKQYLKEAVKPPKTNTAVGVCELSEDKTKLTFSIEKGKAKPNNIKRTLKKSKILPPTIKVLEFVELGTTNLAQDNTVVNEGTPINIPVNQDTLYPDILSKTKAYKQLGADTDTSVRLEEAGMLSNMIRDWEEENQPHLADKVVAKKHTALQTLKGQLAVQSTNIQINNRTNIEDITPILMLWDEYKKIPTKATGIEALPLIEKRIEAIEPVSNAISRWFKRNFGRKSKEEQSNEKKLDRIQEQIDKQKPVLQQHLVVARKKYAKSLLKYLSGMNDTQKKQAITNQNFMADVHRYVSVTHINAIRKFLGLGPVTQVDPLAASPETKAAWDDPEIQAMFSTLGTTSDNNSSSSSSEQTVVADSKPDFSGFDENVTVHYRQNPTIETTISLPANAAFYTEGGMRQILSSPYTFKVISEDANGRLKVDGGGTIYYLDKGVGTINGYVKTDAPLFPRDPKPQDVKQGGVGDCYLMAIMSSLAKSDPQFIKDMMQDKGSSVVVRLFHVTADRSGKKSFKARYFEIEKSVVKGAGGEDRFAKDVLWVQMLEKAYVAGGFTGMFNEYIGNLNDQETTYDTIGTGGWGFAMEVLTGRPHADLFFQSPNHSEYIVTDLTDIERGTVDPAGRHQGIHPPWCTYERNSYSTARSTRDYQRLNAYKIVGGDLTKLRLWFHFVNGGSITNLFNREHNDSYSGELTIDDFSDLFAGKMKDGNGNEVPGLAKLDAAVAKDIITWISSEKIYPGKRGSGIYSQLQLNLFQKISEAVDKNELVTIGSKAKLGQSEGSGHSAGESLSGGLVGPHMYSVFNHRQDSNKELLIRNPWGKYEQKNVRNAQGDLISTANTGTRPEDNDGEFWLLLEDLTRSFNGICIG
jgi:hypothetical protein